MKYVSQIVAYALFAVVVGLFSVWPRYALLDPQKAIVSLAFPMPASASASAAGLLRKNSTSCRPICASPTIVRAEGIHCSCS